MNEGYPLRIADLLPPGMRVDDLYFLLAAIVGVIILATLGRSFVHRNKFAVRVRALQERRAQLKTESMQPRKRTRAKKDSGGIDAIRSMVNGMQLLQKSQIGKINQSLITAGYRSKDAIYIYAFFQTILPFVMMIFAGFTSGIDLNDPFSKYTPILFILGMGYFGVKLPGIIVANARTKRYLAIQRGLSDTLDLMLVCAEAGLSLAATLDRVSRELGMTYPIMAEELALTSIELGFLPERKKALTNLAERVDMPEIRGIASVLIQTEKYGTPVSQALRVLSSEFRNQRMLRAEQKAARLPAIMTVPMIVFILPTLFVVIITPAIIKLLNTQ